MRELGELFGDLVPFSNVNGEFERLGAGAFRISGAGANAWQGTDQYTTLYKPAGGDDEYDAIVRVDASTLVNNSGKAGLIIRSRRGTSRPCRLAPQGLAPVESWLTGLRDAMERNYDRLDALLTEDDPQQET